MTAQRQPDPITVAAFDAFVDRQPDDRDYELIEGVIVMMSNPSTAHGEIAGAIGAPLKLAMRLRGCRVYQGDVRVQRSADTTRETEKYRPDVVVRCGPFSPGNFITDPVVVVEVLSPSTIDIDRGPKVAFYKTLPTVQHIALVYQDEMRVEHYRRDGDTFTFEVLKAPADELNLVAVDFRIDLAAIYVDVPV